VDAEGGDGEPGDVVAIERFCNGTEFVRTVCWWTCALCRLDLGCILGQLEGPDSSLRTYGGGGTSGIDAGHVDGPVLPTDGFEELG
jgi:hypothetical protein